MMVRGLILFLIVFFFSCGTQIKQRQTFGELRFLSQIVVPHKASFNQTTIGGLSGIDYNAKENLFYLLSDDRSVHNPSRFYTAKIDLNQNQINFKSVAFLKNENQENFSNFKQDPTHSVDPEEIRFLPSTKQILWTSEGERLPEHNLFLNPTIYVSDSEGNFVKTVTLPSNLRVQKKQVGPRRNGTLESLAIAKDGFSIYTALEEPLHQDGPKSSLTHQGLARIFQANLKNGNTKQFAYRLERVAKVPNPKDAFSVNGITSMIALGNEQLLIVERSYSTGVESNTIKLFLANIAKATNVDEFESIQEKEDEIQWVKKELILNLDDLGFEIDNIEGATFGPILPNGNLTLFLVSDDNFSKKQKTQILIFELIKSKLK